MATLLQRQFSNRAYWEKREREAREKYLRSEAQQLAEIDKIYRQMYQWAEDEINRFYGKYAGLEGIDITDAKKRVSAEDVKAFEEKAAKYVKDRNFSDQASAELRLYNATMKINRLELLKAQIGLGLVDGFNEMDLYEESELTERAIEEITRQAGILGTSLTDADTVARAKQIVNATFYNATFSQRIWSHCDNLSSAIAIELQKGLIAGVGSRQMATNLRKVYNVSVNDAHRLMVTELRRVQTDVAMDSYKDANITQYMYMAVNPKACPICKRLNNKIYEVKGAEVGNPDHPLPPMHPRCHCTTAPYIDEAEYEAWLNFIEAGGSTAEWDALDPQEKARLIGRPTEQRTLQDELIDAYEYHRTANNLTSASYQDMLDKGIDNVVTADLGNLGTKDLFTDTLTGLMRRYDTPLQKISLMDKTEAALGSFASVRHNYEAGRAELIINPAKCSNKEKLLSRIKELCESGYAVKVRESDYGKYIATHEFAHTLLGNRDPLDNNRNFVGEDYKKLRKARAEIENIYAEYKTELANLNANYKNAEKQFIQDFDADAGKRAREYKAQYDKIKLSDYSLENKDEFMAEAFTHSELSDIDNSYANRVRKVLDDNFRR